MKKMLPIPNIEGVEIPESAPFLAEGMHRKLRRFSPGDYEEIGSIWTGDSLDGSGPLEVIDGPPTGGPQYEMPGVASALIPDYHPEEILEIVRKPHAKALG